MTRQLETWHMQRALQLAARGRGFVEPNPMVGCVVARGAEVLAEGWHRRFGAAHAEAEALEMVGRRAAGATMFVTLEPCCHHGKTPPCTEAILRCGVSRVVVAADDPFPKVNGGGLAQLRAGGLEVEVGLMGEESRRLNAPYLKLLETGRSWVIAKWAMSLDGKIATHSGDSRWISSPASRAAAHALRGRVDAVIIGSRTAAIDDPLLTARPPGPRTAARVVVDSTASLAPTSQLANTARQSPVLIAAAEDAPQENRDRLQDAGCEVLLCPGDTRDQRLAALLDELGRRKMTNVLVEGGGTLLGALWDGGHVDEVHVFLAPKLIGGTQSPTPLAGKGFETIAGLPKMEELSITQLDQDVYVTGRAKK